MESKKVRSFFFAWFKVLIFEIKELFLKFFFGKSSLTFKDIELIYDHNNKGIKNINFSLECPSLFLLVGPSGSGKSTLLNIISGIIKPQKGEIIFCKKGSKSLPKVSYLNQEYSLFDTTIAENIAFGVEKKNINYLFKNVITITNKGKNSIQIISKHKKILETFGIRKLNSILKEKYIIKPGKKLTLNLNYSVQSKIATIKGYFSMISLNNSSKFRAYIPKTKLSHPEILN